MSEEIAAALRETLEQAKMEAAGLDRRLRPLQMQRDVLTKQIEALEITLQRFTSSPGAGDPEWVDIPRTEAILKVMYAEGGPISVKNIFKTLKAKGRSEENINGVHSALSRLKARGLLKSLGGGLWTLTEQAAIENGQTRAQTSEGMRVERW